MKKAPKEKRTLLEIGNVRVVENDERNVVVERWEETLNPSTKETSSSWRFKGYSGTILEALRFIASKELLDDRNAIKDLESHLKVIEESHAKILEAIKK